jgi:hypothetical protein
MLYSLHCTICNVKVPFGDTATIRVHESAPGTRRVFDPRMKAICSTDLVVMREADINKEKMTVRERKPIFVAACNMADDPKLVLIQHTKATTSKFLE